MLLVVYQSCVPKHRSRRDFLQDMAQHPHRRIERKARFVGSVSSARKCETIIGSKTRIGLTYLKLGLINVPWLRHVSDVRCETVA